MKASTTLITLLALLANLFAVSTPGVAEPAPPVITAAPAPTVSQPLAGSTPEAVNTQTDSMTTDGGRTYLLTTPSTGTVTRLIVTLHWSTGTGASIRRISGFDAMARASGNTAVAYPNGINTSWNAGGCCRQNSNDDVGFLDAMISDIKDRFPTIKRVVMFGQSNGGMMAYRYWFEGSHRISAFAVQSAAISEGGDFPAYTEVPYPAHLMHWHGAIDSIVPIGGRQSKDLSRAKRSPYCPLFATVSMAVAAADAELDRWRIRDDDSSVTVWKGSHAIRLRILPDSGHGGEGAPWPDDRHEFAWRWMILKS